MTTQLEDTKDRADRVQISDCASLLCWFRHPNFIGVQIRKGLVLHPQQKDMLIVWETCWPSMRTSPWANRHRLFSFRGWSPGRTMDYLQQAIGEHNALNEMTASGVPEIRSRTMSINNLGKEHQSAEDPSSQYFWLRGFFLWSCKSTLYLLQSITSGAQLVSQAWQIKEELLNWAVVRHCANLACCAQETWILMLGTQGSVWRRY